MESIHDRIKEGIREHRDEIELIQIGVTSALASLVYSEYIRNFKQVIKPTRKIFVSNINNVINLLDPVGEFGIMLSDRMIKSMANTPLMKEYSNVPELTMFQAENIDILQSIFELYMMPNMGKSIPATIVRKFGLMNDNNQMFQESGDIDLFNRVSPGESHLQFIVDQAVLQILLLAPGVDKRVVDIEVNNNIEFPGSDHAILSVGNDNAISIVHFNSNVCDNTPIMELLEFVTSTKFTTYDGPRSEDSPLGVMMYKVTSSPYNQVMITYLKPNPVNQMSMFD